MLDCRPFAARFAAIASLIALGACAPDYSSPFQIAANQANTPSCDGGNGPVVGRVSGTVDMMPGQRPVSYVGCFNDMASCQAWRAQMSGTINGRIIYDECTAG